MTSEDDRTIVERVLAGDKLAFGELIERYRVGALAFAWRLLRNANAEDAVQEAFLAAFLKLENLRDRDRFRAWLFGILANLCHSRLRLLREDTFTTYWADRQLLASDSKMSSRRLRPFSKPESCIA
jgi:DNA-directed RNA polymerase specialized sigma24 family protein